MTSSGGRKNPFPKIEIPYYVQDCKSVFKRRIILQIPSPKNVVGATTKKSIILNQFETDPDSPNVRFGNVWIRFGCGEGEVDVEYLPEGGIGRDLSHVYGQQRETEQGPQG